jgi:hypothetical protein
MSDLASTIVMTRGELVALCLASVLVGCACMLVAILMHGDLREKRREQRAFDDYLEEVRRVQDAELRGFEARRRELRVVMSTPLPRRRG